MIEFDIETWCAKQSYVTLSDTKKIIFALGQGIKLDGFTPKKSDKNKLQQIQAIEKANRIKF